MGNRDNLLTAMAPRLKPYRSIVFGGLGILEVGVAVIALVIRPKWISAGAVVVLGVAFVAFLTVARKRHVVGSCACLGRGTTAGYSSAAGIVRGAMVVFSGCMGVVSDGLRGKASPLAVGLTGCAYGMGLLVVSPEFGAWLGRCKRPFVFAMYDALAEVRRTAQFRLIRDTVDFAVHPSDQWTSDCTAYFSFPCASDDGRVVVFSNGPSAIQARIVDMPPELLPALG